MSPRPSAEDQLRRILLLLPEAVKATREEGSVSISELAEAVGTGAEQVADDLREVAARAYYLPPGLGDDLQIRFDGERVAVRTTGAFRRPVRLTGPEATAVAVALRSRLAGPGQDGEGDGEGGLELARRLERELAVEADGGAEDGSSGDPAPAGRPSRGSPAPSGSGGDGSGPDGAEGSEAPSESGRAARWVALGEAAGRGFDLLGLLDEAARDRRICRMRYLKPGRPEPEARILSPYRLVYAEGAWYAVGHSRKRDAVRTFRLDRILELRVTDEEFPPPADFDLEAFLTDQRPYEADDDVEAVVRYSAEIARWIRERWDGEENADGSFRVRHRVADPTWLVRHVLQYAGEAEVLEPAHLRAAVREAAERVAGRGVE